MSETVILSAVRSPIGRFLGGFSNTSATDLGSKVAATALEGIDPSVVDEALMVFRSIPHGVRVRGKSPVQRRKWWWSIFLW